MDIRAIVFDINGTLIDILTDEGNEEIYRAIARFLTYQGISLRRGEVRDLFFEIMAGQRRASREKYPEFDVVEIWRTIISRHGSAYTRSLPAEKLAQLPLFLSEMYRGISRIRLKLYPGVLEVLGELRAKYRLAAVSDAQSPWATAELREVGLMDYFSPLIVSGDFGYRKPDGRLWQMALDRLALRADQVIFVGNDMYRDIYGARQQGIKTVFFSSNQGDKERAGVEADYVIYNFVELLQAIAYFDQSLINPASH